MTIVRESLHSANFWEHENVRCEVTSSGGVFRVADLRWQHHFLLFNMPEPPSWTQSMSQHYGRTRSLHSTIARRVRFRKPLKHILFSFIRRSSVFQRLLGMISSGGLWSSTFSLVQLFLMSRHIEPSKLPGRSSPERLASSVHGNMKRADSTSAI